jgi:hypothetical protein
MEEEELQQHARLALSTAGDTAQAAQWIEGVLQGSALLVLHQDGLWRVLDRWLSELAGDTFEALLPILRRAFAGFQASERRAMGEKVQALNTTDHYAGSTRRNRSGTTEEALDHERATIVLPLLAQILRGAAHHDH